MSTLLTSDHKEGAYKNQTLQSLSVTGRLMLCHLHVSETETWRTFLLACLNKDVNDSIKYLMQDNSLFEKDLPENVKSIKTIRKTGAEFRPLPLGKKVRLKGGSLLSILIYWN